MAGLVVACVLSSLGCQPAHTTQRVYDGQSFDGPYIEPETYAAYAEGSYLEARGEWREAEHAYRRALARDSKSPAIWTRLGVIACQAELKRALGNFQTDGVSREYAPAWAERAHCLHRHGKREDALESARRAILLDPGNARANLLIADVYRELSRPEKSRAWLFAWLLRDPRASSHSLALYERAKLLDDTTLGRLALAETRRRAELGAADVSGIVPPRSAPSPRAEPGRAVHAALHAGDLSEARVAASEQGLSMLDLALLAASNGQPALALTQAELVLAADPENGDAVVAALFASALLGDPAKFEALLERIQKSTLPGMEPARIMTELLRWQVGDVAAEKWTEAYRRAKGSTSP